MPKLTIHVDSSQAVKAIRQLEGEFGSLDKQIKYVEKSSKGFSKNMKKTIGAVGGILAGGFAIHGVSKFSGYLADVSDQYTLLDAKIKLITKDQDQFNDAYEQLYELSKDTSTSLAGNAQAFAKLGNAMPDTDYEEVIGYLTTVNQSLITSGATTQEAAGFMIQFAQAMGTGVVNGDELRTMNEANSYLMRKIAKEFDTTTAGLKALGAANLLTTEKFAAALQTVAKEVKDTYGDIPVTIKRALNKLDQVWMNILGGADDITSSSRSFVSAIEEISSTVETHGPAIISLFAAMVSGAGFAVEGVGGVTNAVKGLAAVAAGELDFFALMTMDAKELREELEKIDNGLSGQEAITAKILEYNRDIQRVKSERPWTEAGRDEQTQELSGLRKMREAYRTELQRLKDEVNETIDQELELYFSPQLDTSDAEASLATLSKMQQKSATEWLESNEKAATKSIKQYVKELEKANEDIIGSTRDFAEELSSLQREGMTDDGAWKSVTAAIENYKQKAAEAAKAGEWDSQLDYLERAKNLIGELSSGGTTKLVDDASVENAKKVWEYQKRITRNGKDAYGDAANPYKKAKKDYQDLLNARKKGEIESISKQQALNTKVEYTKFLNEAILEAKNRSYERTDKEKSDLEATVAAYKTAASELLKTNDGVEESVTDIDAAWVKTGDTWKRISDDIGGEMDKLIAKLDEMAKKSSPFSSGKSSNSNTSANPDQTIGQLAAGGPAKAKTPYWVGEKGEPELFVPDSSGTVIPLDKLIGNGQNNVPISLYFNNTEEPINVFGNEQSLRSLQQAEQDQRRYAG